MRGRGLCELFEESVDWEGSCGHGFRGGSPSGDF